jgi:Cys-tRNA(Pro)/Cys-tRNA(Cys) deacylase
MATNKTNAMRILDKEQMRYELISYKVDGKIDGESVAAKMGKPAEVVFKTLVTHNGPSLFVFVIPVNEELDLKKAAKAAGEKKLELLPVKELQKWTGYIRGGCSPVGMKKLYPTFIEKRAKIMDLMIVSAGKIGMQLELSPADLAKTVKASLVDLIH